MSEGVWEGAVLPKDGLPPPRDVLAEATGGGGGRAPVGLLTRLLRRSARYAAASLLAPIVYLSRVRELLMHTELVVGHVGWRGRRDLPGGGPLLGFASGEHDAVDF